MKLFKNFFTPKPPTVEPPSVDDDATVLSKAADKGSLEEVRRMLERGVHVDTPDKHKRTALMLASRTHHLNVVCFLVEQGANVNASDASGNTALLLALGGDQKLQFDRLLAPSAIEIVSSLISTGHADVTLPDNCGKTALMLAAWYGAFSLTESLIGAGAHVNATLATPIDAEEGGAAIAPVFIPRPRNTPGNTIKRIARLRGGTALMMAAAQGHLDVVRLLLRSGADPTKTVGSNQTARSIANLVGDTVQHNWGGTDWGRKTALDYRQIVLDLDASSKAPN